MKRLLPLLVLLLTACAKDDIEVKYYADCDDCKVHYVAADGTTKSVDLDTGTWIPNQNPPKKMPEFFQITFTAAHDFTPTVTVERDSGMAGVWIRSEGRETFRKVTGDIEVVELH